MPELLDPFEEIIKNNPKRFPGPREIECGYGWTNLIKEFLQELDILDPIQQIQLFCIKEKFGFLEIQNQSFLYDFFDNFYLLTDKYRHLSKSVCETCGEPGKLKSSGTWLSVSCKDHQK
jgi:5-bromo-4-chloroindolyl phosphate hydrolysis protein